MLKSKRRLPVILLGVCLGPLPGFLAAAPGPAPSAAHQTFLKNFREVQVQALLKGDIAPLVPALRAENLRLMPITQPTVFGPVHAIAYYRAFLDRFDVRDYTRTSVGQFDLGARVVEVGRFSQKLTHQATGETFDLDGKYLDAWEKRPDGTLQLITIAWNADTWLPAAEAMRFPDVPSVRTAFEPRAPINSEISFELAALGMLHEAAVVQKNARLWSRFFADDALMLANNGPLCAGRTAVDDYIATHSPQLPFFEKLDLRTDRIEELGDYVFEYASQVANWRRGEASGVSTGKNLRIWRREPGQALKIVLSIGSYD
jgi:ketosteroid isomerase-like protein